MAPKQTGKKFVDFAIAFLKIAKEDLERAESSLADKGYPDTVFHAQQCVEKSVKAALEMEKFYIGEHELSKYFFDIIVKKASKQWKDKLSKILSCLDWFRGEWQATRYPRIDETGKVIVPSEKYDKRKAEEALKKAHFVFSTTTKFLREKYSLKFE